MEGVRRSSAPHPHVGDEHESDSMLHKLVRLGIPVGMESVTSSQSILVCLCFTRLPTPSLRTGRGMNDRLFLLILTINCLIGWSVRQSVCDYLTSLATCLSAPPCIHPSIRPFVHSSIHPSSVLLPLYQSNLFICLLVGLSVGWSLTWSPHHEVYAKAIPQHLWCLMLQAPTSHMTWRKVRIPMNPNGIATMIWGVKLHLFKIDCSLNTKDMLQQQIATVQRLKDHTWKCRSTSKNGTWTTTK